MTGIVALTIGATIVLPITWFLTSWRCTKLCWALLLISILGVCVVIGYIVLHGDIFNPWFTAFSYLKGAILIMVSVVVAGTLVLMIERLFQFMPNLPPSFRRQGVILAITAIFGFLPFYTLGKYPEVKVAVLLYNEIARVNTTFAREFANIIGLGRWIHLGQSPSQNDSPHPWPQPWRLEKTHQSSLPENFNLLVIVVDALRGDAFYSAGYHRNLTPLFNVVTDPGEKTNLLEEKPALATELEQELLEYLKTVEGKTHRPIFSKQ